jgi:hypothetical protein
MTVDPCMRPKNARDKVHKYIVRLRRSVYGAPSNCKNQECDQVKAALQTLSYVDKSKGIRCLQPTLVELATS